MTLNTSFAPQDPVLTDTPHKFQFARSVQSQDLTLVTHMHINKYVLPPVPATGGP